MESPEAPKSRLFDGYNEAVRELPPSATLVKAVGLVEGREAALDVGAGSLRDSRYLRAVGFERVVALDLSPVTAETAAALGDDKIEVVTAAFGRYDYPIEAFDVVNAQVSLPFTPAVAFDRVLVAVKASLKPNGVFAGTFFGPRHGADGYYVVRSADQLREAFADMEIVMLDEVEGVNAVAYKGRAEYNDHLIRLIARKSAVTS